MDRHLGLRLFALTLFFATLSPAFAEEPAAEPSVDLKKLSVDELVERLVSPFPAPKIGDGWGFEADWTFIQHPHYRGVEYGVVHPQVTAASEELVSRGRDAVPTLLKHTDDRRYASTGSSSVKFNQSVGYRVRDIIETVLYPEILIDWSNHGGGFKGQPSFRGYLGQAGGAERYLEWSKRVTEREREFDYLRWYAKKVDELRNRFPWNEEPGSAMLDEHLAPYLVRIGKLEAAGVAMKSPIEENPPAADR